MKGLLDLETWGQERTTRSKYLQKKQFDGKEEKLYIFIIHDHKVGMMVKEVFYSNQWGQTSNQKMG